LLILKHVEYELHDKDQLNMLIDHLNTTTTQIEGIKFIDIYFPSNKREFVLFLECKAEKAYQEWRKICPPPDGADDWFEMFLTKEETF
jgi:hypothetical protein